MLRTRQFGSLVVAGTLLASLPGCLTLYSKTEVVRGGEARRPVKFESPEAADEFYKALKAQDKTISGTFFGVPFVTLFEKDQQLSDAAMWNDAVVKCDTDQDGLITLTEARIFAKLHE